MGTLIAKKYSTKLFLKAADHTYVECGTGAKGWSCWGGKTGGAPLRSGIGSTTRAEAIAGNKERAGITCYLVNGVCHQAANRILLPSGITVRGARGYSISEALFGTYGRVGIWPCHAPFSQRPGVTGDLPACVPVGGRLVEAVATDSDQRDWAYTRSVLAIYARAKSIEVNAKRATTARTGRGAKKIEAELETFHLELFRNQCAFNLGPQFDRTLERTLLSVRRATERKRVSVERARGARSMQSQDFISAFNALTIDFQKEMANALSSARYETLLGMKRDDEPIVLADPDIVGTP